jgi:hypothetical protein
MLGRSSPKDLGGGIDHVDHGSNPAKNAPEDSQTTSMQQNAGTKACLEVAYRWVLESVRREIIFHRTHTLHGRLRAQ